MHPHRGPQFFYAILDGATREPRRLPELATRLFDVGVRWFQLRAKELSSADLVELARELRRRIPQEHGGRLLINDRLDVAMLSDACGVHLGQEDLPYSEARALLGPSALIGLSTHNPAQAVRAEQLGADYIGFGPIFPTTTKADAAPTQGTAQLASVVSRVSCPIVAIGGVTPDNAGEVWASGVDALAAIGAVCASDEPERAVQSLLVTRTRPDDGRIRGGARG